VRERKKEGETEYKN